jgi:hypothetical protein
LVVRSGTREACAIFSRNRNTPTACHPACTRQRANANPKVNLFSSGVQTNWVRARVISVTITRFEKRAGLWHLRAAHDLEQFRPFPFPPKPHKPITLARSVLFRTHGGVGECNLLAVLKIIGWIFAIAHAVCLGVDEYWGCAIVPFALFSSERKIDCNAC